MARAPVLVIGGSGFIGGLSSRSIVRVESSRATMQMAEPFTNVWLPDAVAMRFRVGSAAGPLEARYDVKYRDYRLTEVSGRVR